MLECLKDSTIESLKREIEEFKVEKMKYEYHKCENKEYPCDAIGEQLNKANTPTMIIHHRMMLVGIRNIEKEQFNNLKF